LSAFGIVEKKQGSAGCCRLLKRANFYLAYDNAFLLFLMLRALTHEFARISRVIIQGAAQSEKLSDPSTI
jgi:hypothetical protein